MKIGVVGTFNRDMILPWQGEKAESIGGIYFSVLYLANLLNPTDEIYPVANLGEDFYDEVVNGLSDYKNLRLDGLKRLEEKNTQVTLTYTSQHERDEFISKSMPPLGFSELAILQEVDAVIFNLITGMDVDLNGLRKFRQSTNVLIYLDFHSRALGINGNGRRFYQRPGDWREWIELVDVLQLNEMEARTLAGYTPEQPKEILVEFGKKMLQLNPSVCHITLADKGSYLFYFEGGHVKHKRFKALSLSNAVDAIGCGDGFAAAYLAKYFSTRDEIRATAFANKVAALNCTFVGSSRINEIKTLIREAN